jgi:tRNA(adenine34) deaminase
MEAAIIPTPDSVDRRMMMRCIELSREGAAAGELPFGSVVARSGELLGQSANRAVRDGDLSRHAEIVAIAQAQRRAGRQNLGDCTLYSTVEPCPMCSFCIREAGIGRVILALQSPVMGGLSRWNILRDETLSHDIPFVFGAVPEVVTGVLAQEAARVWRDWNILFWQVIKLRRLLVEPVSAAVQKSPKRHVGSLRGLVHGLYSRPWRA